MRALLAALALAAAQVHAADAPPSATRTAFFYVPMKGVLALTPQTLYTLSSPFDSTRSGATIADTTLRQGTFGLSMDYGALSALSVGALGNYRRLDTRTSARGAQGNIALTNEGFSDVSLYVRGLLPAGRVTLLYGITQGFSPDHAATALADSHGNQFSGGHSLQPLLGLQAEFAQGHFLGLRMSYLKRSDRTVESGTAVKTLSGGDDFELATIYYERRSMPWMADLVFSLDRIGETRTDGVLSAASYTTPTLQARGYFTLSRRVVLIAGYGIQKIPSVTAGAAGTSGYLLHTVGAGLRTLLVLP